MHWLRSAGLVTILFCFGGLVRASADTGTSGRLPKDAEPLLYDLSLRILPDQVSFSGTAKIRVKISKETDVMHLHGKDLAVQKSSLILKDGTRIDGKYTQINPGGMAQITFPRKIEPQEALLQIVYRAPFNQRLEGLYHVEEDRMHYAFTQFEAISARLCFPGFDEPSYKTPFDITLTVRKEDLAISNTLPTGEKVMPDGTKQVQFRRTERLPTYLVAFAVGPFDVVSGEDIRANQFRKEPIPLRGIAVRGKGKHLQYALKTTGSILEALEKYFESGYMFHKLDLIAVPDFDWGAMENAGAITFRETFLLLDEQNASYSQKKSYAGVMAHELAHHWFGNSVTMAWWDDIWLNEGLTSWMDDRVIQEWNPDYKASTAAVQGAFRIMDSDSSESARPLHRPISDANEIKTIADGIIFTKGAAIPRMMERFMGKDTFRKVVHAYLQKYRFSNATSEDFLAAIESVAGKPAAEACRSFLFQPGVPYLDVKLSCGQKGGQVSATQTRYLPLGANAPSESVWHVPVCVRYAANNTLSTKCDLFGSGNAMKLERCPEWIMPNADGTGYYRWNLPSEHWKNLREKGTGKLSLAEQIAVIDSIQAGFAAGKISASDAFQVMATFTNSDDREIAMAPVDLFSFFRNYLLDSVQIERLRTHGREWYRPAYQKLKFDSSSSDTDEIKLFRSELIAFLAFEAQDTEIRRIAKQRGLSYTGFGTDGKIHPDAVDPNLVETVLGVAVQEDPAVLDHLIDILKKSNDSVLRSRILSAVGRATIPAQVQKVLQLSLDPALRTNEVLSPLNSLLIEKENWEPVWQFVRANFDAIVKRISPTDAGGLPSSAAYFCTDDKANEVKHFFEERAKELSGGPRNLQRIISQIKICAAKAKAHREDALRFFAQ